MSILESMLYGFFSGLAEFLPISSQGHQMLMSLIFHAGTNNGLRNLLIHMACLLAIIVGIYPYLLRLYKEKLLISRNKSRRKKTVDYKSTYDIRLLKTASISMLIGMLLHFFIGNISISLLWLGLLFILNGVVLFIQDHVSHGNKDSRKMTGLDAVTLGLGGALSILPGISRVGTGYCVAVMRGADKMKAVNWVMVLSIPALVLLSVSDLVGIFTLGLGVSSFVDFIGCVLSAIMAFLGAYGAILLMRILARQSGYSVFAYYSWGAALLSLILYLTA